ncbi:MAG: lipoyl(octanoyl) transferase LipB [Rhodospirillaceae bacterium]|jgi:lipoyl(octanoyl) transferase|nr:lipoyl(octanoyl) transferase LipB [Rhodospirillaceae bacterium]MBT5244843.1 lipoyl(octanoyl) transferase LipB [Rhodospirillaceae bacterium]MBT5563623.1 lipoyl(octanoyl) transferase LipB [Rhodospirillaceae bacterium]MBT6241454.1 lipoyl(octanoyl) transferase LipB [Rhodospirillaceae bacterium]MBT7138843.1 lipoyl(octanoyl) transferase LipB [Rhodospirillaceae bacterium]
MVNNFMEWLITEGPVPYEAALAFMEKRVGEIRSGEADEAVCLLEHPPLYTAGTSADPADLLDPERFPVHTAGRGGQYTYHGPGQRVAYAMIDLKGRGNDVRAYVHDLEEWIIRTLKRVGVTGERREGRIGIWVTHPDGREDKVAALGVRVRRWVTFHGIAINVNPDLGHFDGIVPCGIEEYGVTSLADLGLGVTMAEIDEHLRAAFAEVFEVPLPVPQGFVIR